MHHMLLSFCCLLLDMTLCHPVSKTMYISTLQTIAFHVMYTSMCYNRYSFSCMSIVRPLTSHRTSMGKIFKNISTLTYDVEVIYSWQTLNHGNNNLKMANPDVTKCRQILCKGPDNNERSGKKVVTIKACVINPYFVSDFHKLGIILNLTNSSLIINIINIKTTTGLFWCDGSHTGTDPGSVYPGVLQGVLVPYWGYWGF